MSVAKRYSKALIGLCDKDKSHDHVARDLDKVLGALEKHVEFRDAMTNPTVGQAARRQVMEHVAKSLVLRPLTRNFLLYVSDRKRMDQLEAITVDFKERLDVIAGRVNAAVITAKPLTALEKQRIQGALEKTTGKKVHLDASVDESILGGAITQVGNIVLDGSVRAQLNKMKTQLIEAVRQ